jgi:hypothetical protein
MISLETIEIRKRTKRLQREDKDRPLSSARFENVSTLYCPVDRPLFSARFENVSTLYCPVDRMPDSLRHFAVSVRHGISLEDMAILGYKLQAVNKEGTHPLWRGKPVAACS